MKLISHFNEFLNDTVNLNDTRLTALTERADAIKNFVRQTDWGATVKSFYAQGSWAHKTIIRPVDGGEFDADLLVLVDPVDGWTAKDYVKRLGKAFRNSSTYKDKVRIWDYCVTITYANDAQIDVAPLVVNRGGRGDQEVCNKSNDKYEISKPQEYTEWLNERNGYSGGNSFRKVTRLLKYLRDIKTRFVCSSVLLTTLIGNQITIADKGSSDFADVPSALQTIMQRLDDWLQKHSNKPQVCNPKLTTEDFASSWTQAQYDSFRKSINRYRKWVDEAVAADTRDASVLAWRRLFGDEFAPGVDVKKAGLAEGAYALASAGRSAVVDVFDDLVDLVKTFGARAIPRNYSKVKHMQRPTWRVSADNDVQIKITATIGGGAQHRFSNAVESGQPLRAGQQIFFEAVRDDGTRLGPDYIVHWRITNTGDVPQLRGDFYPSSDGLASRQEALSYRGVHLAEAFVVLRSSGALAGVSDPFFVVIE